MSIMGDVAEHTTLAVGKFVTAGIALKEIATWSFIDPQGPRAVSVRMTEPMAMSFPPGVYAG